MGYYSGDLSIEAAREMARNEARQAASRARVPKGWCNTCNRHVRMVPTNGDVLAHLVHIDDGTRICDPGDGATE